MGGVVVTPHIGAKNVPIPLQICKGNGDDFFQVENLKRYAAHVVTVGSPPQRFRLDALSRETGEGERCDVHRKALCKKPSGSERTCTPPQGGSKQLENVTMT